jgi:predicted nucleotidyltransferase
VGVDLQTTLRHLRHRESERRSAAAERASRLRASLPRVTGLLRRKHGVTRVLLFGSLATGSATTESDIDLAVEGLATERYFDALADLMEIVAGPADLVRLEEASSSLRQRILEEGVEL